MDRIADFAILKYFWMFLYIVPLAVPVVLVHLLHPAWSIDHIMLPFSPLALLGAWLGHKTASNMAFASMSAGQASRAAFAELRVAIAFLPGFGSVRAKDPKHGGSG